MRHIHRITARLVLAGVVAATLPATTTLACLPPITGSGSGEAYNYMTTVVASMGYAKEGMDRHRNNKKATAADLLFNVKQAAEDYACAQKIVANFMASKDERIRKTAELLSMSYESIADNERQTGESLVSLLNRKDPLPAGTMAEQTATLRQQSDAAWRGLMQALTITSQTLPMFKPDGTNARCLRLKQAERNELQRELERTFGKSIRKGMQKGQNYLTTAAAGLHSFLGNTHWKSSDEA